MSTLHSEERVHDYVRVREDRSAACRVCERSFPDVDGALSHVRGLLEANAFHDHCRIHGYDELAWGYARSLERPHGLRGTTAPLRRDRDPERRRWNFLDLFGPR